MLLNKYVGKINELMQRKVKLHISHRKPIFIIYIT